MESGFPGIRWWHLKYWDKELRVKKEELTLPTIVNIKVKLPSTPHLLYPSESPTTPSLRYHSLDPNNFENWGDLATIVRPTWTPLLLQNFYYIHLLPHFIDVDMPRMQQRSIEPEI